MNVFDNQQVDTKSFSWLDLLGQDRWESFTVAATGITVVGTPTYTGRYRFVGRACEFQIRAVSDTSIATVAGTSYFALPRSAGGLAGMAAMTNATTNVAVGLCHIDVANSRVYLPSQVASGNTFHVCGSFEIGA